MHRRHESLLGMSTLETRRPAPERDHSPLADAAATKTNRRTRLNAINGSIDSDADAVRFAAVSKTFDGKTLVVDDLNLIIRNGEFLTMLGPSGSGKTTCLMMLAGFESLTCGDLFLLGKSVKGTPPYKRNIGMVFQNYALFPHLTVAENLAFPLEARGLPAAEIREKVTRALDMVQLPTLGDRRPAQLSGGQQQRIAVARALVYEPALVLMDEPLGALDKQLREQMQLEIKQIHQRLGLTFVYVTHDQTEALTISDRIAVFNKGRVEQLASPGVLYEAPESVFVAEFLGETNRLVGSVRDLSGSRCRLQLDDGTLISALPVGQLKQGDRAVACIRPEAITLSRPSADKPGNLNSFAGFLQERVYLGDHLRLRVRIGDRFDLSIKVQRQPDYRPPEIGDAVTVNWPAQECRAFADPSRLKSQES